MRESTKESPMDRGQVRMAGRCQVCGTAGDIVVVPGAPEPNQFCARCAIEFGETIGEDEEDLAP
jgi:hypothetical protein